MTKPTYIDCFSVHGRLEAFKTSSLFQCLEDEKKILMMDKTGFKLTICYSQAQTLLNFLLYCQGFNLVEKVLELFWCLLKFLFANKCRLNVYKES